MSHASTDFLTLGAQLLTAFSHTLNDPLDPTCRRGETLLLLIHDASLSARDRLTAVRELRQHATTALSVASSLKRQHRAAVRVLGAVPLDDLSEDGSQEFQTGWTVYCEEMTDLMAMRGLLREQLALLEGRVQREVRTGFNTHRTREGTFAGNKMAREKKTLMISTLIYRQAEVRG